MIEEINTNVPTQFKNAIQEKREVYKNFGIITVEENLNPKKKECNDCVIRAIAKSSGKSYEAVYEEITKVGIGVADMINSDEVISKYLESNNYVDCKEENLNCSLFKFMQNHKIGNYILGTGDHLFAYIDGIWYDSPINFFTTELMMEDDNDFIFRKDE